MNKELLSILIAVFGATGFWTFINTLIVQKREKQSVATKMLLGLGHDRIYELCHKYIARGSITTDELENLVKYLHEPYEGLGGNGTGKRLVDEVKRLPINNSYKGD